MTTRGAGRPPGLGGAQSYGSAGAPIGSEAPRGAGGPHGPQGMHRPRGPNGPNGPHVPFSYPKALVIVVVAVVLGAYLLSLGNGPHGAASPPTTTTPTTAPPSSTTTTAPASTTSAQAKPSKSVTVVVANASHTNGIAGYYTTTLAKDGWGTLTAETATTVETTSIVYFAPGQQANADVVASELHLPATDVHALGATVPVPSTSGADVVVLAGLDLASKAPTTTTTTAG